VANVDALVDLPDGVRWALTFFTVDEVRRLLAVWEETGEAGDGSYFWRPATDRAAARRARNDQGDPGLVRTGEMVSVAVRREAPY
jgi:hypothetical protein